MIGIDMRTLIEVFEGIGSVADGVVDYSVVGGEMGVGVEVVVGELGDLAWGEVDFAWSEAWDLHFLHWILYNWW